MIAGGCESVDVDIGIRYGTVVGDGDMKLSQVYGDRAIPTANAFPYSSRDGKVNIQQTRI